MNQELKKYTDQELLEEIEKRLKTEQIWFWIDQSNCYLAPSFFCEVKERIKIGDVFSTREYIFKQKVKQLRQQAEQKQANLEQIFQQINDVEFVIELAKRTRDKPTIKLSIYPHQAHISITGKDKKTQIITDLPI